VLLLLLLLLLLPAVLQEDANRRANQDKLGQLGLLPLLAKLGADGGGAPSAAVRAQVRHLFRADSAVLSNHHRCVEETEPLLGASV
jgi:hypothetical protein